MAVLVTPVSNPRPPRKAFCLSVAYPSPSPPLPPPSLSKPDNINIPLTTSMSHHQPFHLLPFPPLSIFLSFLLPCSILTGILNQTRTTPISCWYGSTYPKPSDSGWFSEQRCSPLITIKIVLANHFRESLA